MNSKTLTLDSQIPPPPPSQSEFSSSIASIAVAQITRSVGYRASESSALNALTRIATLYLESLAKSAASRATDSGRTQSNLFDVVHALEDINTIRGFPGASDVGRCVLRSGTITEVSQFVKSTKELPFAKPIPKRQKIIDNPVRLEGIGNRKRKIRGAEIPIWLPDVPDMNLEEENNVGREERYWGRMGCEAGGGREESQSEGKMMVEKEQVKRMKMLPWRREKVRFRIRGKQKEGNGNVGKDLKVRKRVCLGGCKRGIALGFDEEQGKVCMENGRRQEMMGTY